MFFLSFFVLLSKYLFYQSRNFGRKLVRPRTELAEFLDKHCKEDLRVREQKFPVLSFRPNKTFHHAKRSALSFRYQTLLSLCRSYLYFFQRSSRSLPLGEKSRHKRRTATTITTATQSAVCPRQSVRRRELGTVSHVKECEDGGVCSLPVCWGWFSPGMFNGKPSDGERQDRLTDHCYDPQTKIVCFD